MSNFFHNVVTLVPNPNLMIGNHLYIIITLLIVELIILWYEIMLCQDVGKWRDKSRFFIESNIIVVFA